MSSFSSIGNIWSSMSSDLDAYCLISCLEWALLFEDALFCVLIADFYLIFVCIFYYCVAFDSTLLWVDCFWPSLELSCRCCASSGFWLLLVLVWFPLLVSLCSKFSIVFLLNWLTSFSRSRMAPSTFDSNKLLTRLPDFYSTCMALTAATAIKYRSKYPILICRFIKIRL